MIVGIVTAEATYPNYSVSQNLISDLGRASTLSDLLQHPAAVIFDSVMVVGGAVMIAGAYTLYRTAGKISISSALPFLLILAGIGAMGIGIFNESFGDIHGLFTVLNIITWGLAAIVAFTQLRSPFRYLSVILGIFVLANFVLFHLGPTVAVLGNGGAERWMVYPLMLWLTGFGGYLMGTSSEASLRS